MGPDGTVAAVDSQTDNLTLLDNQGNLIRKIKLGTNLFTDGVAINSQGHIYVSMNFAHKVVKLDMYGNLLAEIATYGTSDGQVLQPRGLAMNKADELFVIDGTNRIQVFAANGVWARTKVSRLT